MNGIRAGLTRRTGRGRRGDGERSAVVPKVGTCYAGGVRVISRRSLRLFWERHPDVEGALKAWFRETTLAKWQGPADIKAQYASASFVGSDRVVFNIRGNRYRLIVAIKYRPQIVFVRFVGTHRQYDRVDASEV